MTAAVQTVSVRRFAPGGALPETLGVAPAIARGFAGAVARSVQAGVLGYDDRLRLLDRGVRLGLSRFEATLIIAAVQHQIPGALGDRVDPLATPTSVTIVTPSRRNWLGPLALAMGVQLAILAAVAALFG